MKRIRSFFLKVTATVAVLTVVLLAVLAVLLNTSYVQNRVMKYATELLAGKLGTKVVVDSVEISVMRRHVALCGLTIEDQQQRQMRLVNTTGEHDASRCRRPYRAAR